jgi:branched-subunit amino acid transport protein AzlD
VPLTSFERFRFVRGAGYFVAFTTLATELVELILRSWPFRIHSPAWRLGFVGGMSGVVMAALLMLLVVFAIANFADDRITTLIVSAISFVSAVIYVFAAGMFGLDVLQMRNQVQMSVAQQYDVTSAWMLIRVLLGVVGFLILAIATLRSVQAAKKVAPRRTPTGGNFIVGTSRPPTVPKIDETAGAKNG